MPTSSETIIGALKELEMLEKFTLENLMEVYRDPFTPFPKSFRKEILVLLAQLMDDTGEHQKLILKIIHKLQDATKKKK